MCVGSIAILKIRLYQYSMPPKVEANQIIALKRFHIDRNVNHNHVLLLYKHSNLSFILTLIKDQNGTKCYIANRCDFMRIDSDFVLCKVNVCPNFLHVNLT